jgi:hypothetical protein
MRAMKEVDNGHEIGIPMFHTFVGQRMLIEELAELVRPKQDCEQ